MILFISLLEPNIFFNVNKCWCYLLNQVQTNLSSSFTDQEIYTLIDLFDHDNCYSMYHVHASISHDTCFESIDPYYLSFQYEDSCQEVEAL